MGKELPSEHEDYDEHVVAVKKDVVIIGHLLRTHSPMF